MEVDNTPSTAVETAPESQAAAPESNQSVDLDGVSRFTFQGQEYTPEQWSKIFNEHKRFSEDDAHFSKNKKFYDNLDVDLRTVSQQPHLAEVFRERYPKEFHKYLEAIVKQEKQDAQSNQKPNGAPDEYTGRFQSLERQLQAVMNENHQAKVEASLAKIDSLLPPLMSKYPFADENSVLTRAEAMIQGGAKLTDKTWERIARESHEANDKKWSSVHAAKMKEQTEKGQRAKDTGAGGSAPGHAPVKPKGFDGAYDAMLAHVRGNRS